MSQYTQAGNVLRVTTPLGPDTLLITKLKGREAISELYHFEIECLAAIGTEVDFSQLLGQDASVVIGLADGGKRYFNGIVSWISEDDRDDFFTIYHAEIVPRAWLLTHRKQSRIFQHMTVPDILKKVLTGIDTSFEIQGTFEPRDYCVQYRESDFDFACRLMEEEGIFYFFKHDESGHKMVLGNTVQCHPKVPGPSTAIFEKVIGEVRPEDRVLEWAKYQELRAGKTTLWDHNFELPHKHLEADKEIIDSIQVGTVTHKLKVGGNDQLEHYDFPGGYASRFDGIAPGGGDRPGDLAKIFTDNRRTTEIRMLQEAVNSILIEGVSDCRQFTSGHSFTLERHFNSDGDYLLTSVTHDAEFDGYRSHEQKENGYENKFTCIPLALPFSPPRRTPRPVISGTQTAVVVGPAGEEIFTDKYGRVKVQFHWDRQGKNNADSSCWIRVATSWAGKHWGMVHLPRIGQEVVVEFVEGDPNDPIIVGSVYNADMMPPYALPAKKTESGILSRSTKDGNPETCSEFCIDDKKGEELVYLRAEKNQRISVENDEIHWVGHDRTKEVDVDEVTTIGHNRSETVGNDETITIGRNRTESVGKNEEITIAENRKEVVGKDEHVAIGGSRKKQVNGSEKIQIDENRKTLVGEDDTLVVAKKLQLIAGEEIVIKTGDASITMKKDGTIHIKGKDIAIEGFGKFMAKCDGPMTLKGMKIDIN